MELVHLENSLISSGFIIGGYLIRLLLRSSWIIEAGATVSDGTLFNEVDAKA